MVETMGFEPRTPYLQSTPGCSWRCVRVGRSASHKGYGHRSGTAAARSGRNGSREDAGCHLVAPPPARRWTDSTGWTSYSTQKSTYASPTTARPTSDAITATEVIRFACLSSHSSPSDTSGCRATARRRSPTIPRNRHPKRVAMPRNTSAGTISRRAPQPAELLASSSDSSSHGFARSRVDGNARESHRPTRAIHGQPPVSGRTRRPPRTRLRLIRPSRPRREALALGDRPIGALTPSDAQALVNRWSAIRAPRTVRRGYGVLQSIINYAVRLDMLGRSPCRGINLPRTKPVRHRGEPSDRAHQRRRAPSPDEPDRRRRPPAVDAMGKAVYFEKSPRALRPHSWSWRRRVRAHGMRASGRSVDVGLHARPMPPQSRARSRTVLVLMAHPQFVHTPRVTNELRTRPVIDQALHGEPEQCARGG